MNRLAGAASLYLRQHADNPVDWWPWGDAAFAEAERRDVPVFLSIGYAACHWCHVMAHECFEDPLIAAQLNEQTVPVKVDREERPDVDALYMAATQAMNGHGGWPMTVLLTPDGRPFFAGTYFPPEERHGQPGLPQILSSVADVWAHRRDDVLAQADHLSGSVRSEATLLDSLVARGAPQQARTRLTALVDELSNRFDPADGGFSPAPKFPHPSWIEACAATSVLSDREDARTMAVTTLDSMARGGLFDHIAGGFARYSVDARWEVPHFEKMLSDQALLARTYLRASAWFGEPSYAWVARRTLDFVLTHMAVRGGYASAIDADAGGTEGAHIVLTASDVRAQLEEAGLGTLAQSTVTRYSLGDDGPVEGGFVPRLSGSADLVGTEQDAAVRAALLAARATRPQPSIDDKVLLEWNAMLASVLAEAAWRLDEDRYAAAAGSLVASLRETHLAGGRWRRRSGADAPLATSADLGWYIDACVSMFEVDGDAAHLAAAADVAGDLLDGHWDGERPTAACPGAGRGLFQSHRDAGALLVRAKDVLDGAVPSGASVAALALARLSMVGSDESIRAVAERLVSLGQPLLDIQPTAAAMLVEAACVLDIGLEVAVPGPAGELLDAVRADAPPFCVIVHGGSDVALLDHRDAGLVYVCRHTTCKEPISELGSVAGALATAARWEADL